MTGSCGNGFRDIALPFYEFLELEPALTLPLWQPDTLFNTICMQTRS